MSKFQPLTKYLTDSGEKTNTVSFNEIAEILNAESYRPRHTSTVLGGRITNQTVQ